MRRLPLRSPPRVRGKVCHTMAEAKGLGITPRMRGKAVAIFRQLHHGRITPAYAGKSDPEKQPGAARWDHPRVCGEKKIMACYKPLIRGSPPHVRGKAVDGAGQSEGGEDHPRVCGEKHSWLSVGTVL